MGAEVTWLCAYTGYTDNYALTLPEYWILSSRPANANFRLFCSSSQEWFPVTRRLSADTQLTFLRDCPMTLTCHYERGFDSFDWHIGKKIFYTTFYSHKLWSKQLNFKTAALATYNISVEFHFEAKINTIKRDHLALHGLELKGIRLEQISFKVHSLDYAKRLLSNLFNVPKLRFLSMLLIFIQESYIDIDDGDDRLPLVLIKIFHTGNHFDDNR